MATVFSYGPVVLTIEANQSFPLIPVPEPNQAVGIRDNGEQYAEKTRPGSRKIYPVLFEMISTDDYQLIVDFFNSVVDWHRLKFYYRPPNLTQPVHVYLSDGSFSAENYTNDYLRLEFKLIEVSQL